eukprot:SAG22_NODE_119_length_19257_cov_43.260413_26_plen_44_part_00
MFEGTEPAWRRPDYMMILPQDCVCLYNQTSIGGARAPAAYSKD